MNFDQQHRRTGRAASVVAIVVLAIVAISVAFAGGATADDHTDHEDDFDVGPTFEEPDTLDRVYAGQEVVLGDGDDPDAPEYINTSTVSIYEGPSTDSDAKRVTSLEVTDGQTERWDTSDISSDEPHHIRVDSDENDDDWEVEFWAREEEWDHSFDSETYPEGNDNPADFTVRSQRDRQTVNVTAEGLDAADIESIFVNGDTVTNANDENALHDNDDVATLTFDVSDESDDELAVETDLSDLDLGEHEFQFESTDSQASETATVDITDTNSRIAFGEQPSGQQGDLIDIPIELDGADEGMVKLGGEDLGFVTTANVSVASDADPDEITLQYNTYEPVNRGWVVHPDDEDDVTLDDTGVHVDEREDGAALGEAEYEVAISEDTSEANWNPHGEYQIDDVDDTTFLSVEEKQPPGEMQIETAHPDADLVGSEAYEETQTRETNTVAEGDQLIGVVPDFGSSGAIDYLVNEIGLEDGAEGTMLAEAMGVSGIYLELEQQDAPPNVEAKEWNTSPESGDSNVRQLNISPVNFEEYDGDLVVSIDYEEAGLEPGETYDAHLVFTPKNKLVNDAKAEILQDSSNYQLTIDAVEPDLELDAEKKVRASEETTISGTTNVAPGATVDVGVDSIGTDEYSSFIYDDTVEVDEDGTFAASFDTTGHVDQSPLRATAELTESVYTAPADDDGYETWDDFKAVLMESTGKSEAEGIDVSADAPDLNAEESGNVTIEVTNNEDSSVTADLGSTLDDEDVTDDLADRELTVEGGETASTTLPVSGSDLGEGAYDWEVTAESDEFNASDSGTLDVTEKSKDNESDDEKDEDDKEDEDDVETDDDGDSEAQPGFGAAAALVALVVAATVALGRQD